MKMPSSWSICVETW